MLRRLLRDLAAGRRSTLLRVGLRRSSSGRAWLAREILSAAPVELTSAHAPFFWNVQRTDRPPSGPAVAGLSAGTSGRLYIGDERWRGWVWGLVQTPEGIEPIDQLLVAGPGMHRIVTGSRRRNERPAVEGMEPSVPDHRRWSRTIGALGGLDVWRRLIDLQVGVVGCGRSGSVASTMLAGLGIRRLVLIDPDTIEPSNLGEMDIVSSDDLGRAKAQALAGGLERTLTGVGIAITPIVASLVHPDALKAARDCDVLFCCVDNDAARLACAVIATLDHKVLLDVGTGIRFDNRVRGAGGPPRVMGADVRLIIPGDGCLLCRGGLTRMAQALDDLCHPIRPRPIPPDDDNWRGQRAGSLTSLNHLAVGVAVQMFQDLVAERLRSSTWAQLEFDPMGRFAVRYAETAVHAAGDPQCLLCAKAGQGDEGRGS